MKKTLIAIAALASASAFAQSSVTMYGIIDVGPNVVKSTTAAGETTVTGANASGAWASNRLGFKGTEDLGGGLKADFVYELQFAGSTDGMIIKGATNEARQSWAGLSGGFGAVSVGQQYTPIFSLTAATDAGGANNLANGRTAYGQIATTRSNGSVIYTTPTIGGFTVKLNTATLTTDTAGVESGGKMNGASLVYANGPLMVGAAVNSVDKVNATGDKDESYMGATYMMGKATLLAAAGTTKTKDAAGAQSAKRQATQVGVRYPFGKVDTFLTYGTATVNTTEGSADVKSTAYQAGAMYNFSKRTGAYAAYSSTKAETGPVKGSELAVGIRHAF